MKITKGRGANRVELTVCDNCMKAEDGLAVYGKKNMLLCEPCATNYRYLKTKIKKHKDAALVTTAKKHTCSKCQKEIEKGAQAIAVKHYSTNIVIGYVGRHYCTNCAELV